MISLLDGSTATQIAKHVGRTPEGDPLWTSRFLSTNPQAVYATHLDFLRAGSNIIETVTYQASVEGFKEHLGLGEKESLELMGKAVEIAKDAIRAYKKEWKGEEDWRSSGELLVAGSCGPYGASLHDGSEYTGSYGKTFSKEFFKDWHRPRAKALLGAGVDLLAIETIPCVEEALAIVELLKEFPDAKAWLSFSCAKDGIHLASGENFREAALRAYGEAEPDQLVAIGVNCLSPKIVTSLLKDINDEKTSIPLVVYSNSGEVYTSEEGWKREGRDSLDLSDFVHEWLDLGVRFIDGCCRTGDQDIAKIRAQIELWQSHERETPL